MSQRHTGSTARARLRGHRGKRDFAVVALTAALGATLAACGSGGSAASGGGTKSSPVHLVEEDWYGTPTPSSVGPKYLNAFFASYQKSHPGVTITRKSPVSPNYFSLVLSQASAGNLPDLLMVDNPDLATLASTGTILPLSTFGKISTAGINPANLSETTYNGKLYAMPLYTNTIAIFYNKAMFKAAGITTLPKTWAQLMTDAKKLTTPAHYGFLYQTGGGNGGPGTWQSDPFIWSNGGSRRHISSKASVQAVQYLASLVKAGVSPKSVVNLSQAQTIQQFEVGKAAMVENGLWNIPYMQTAFKSLQWGTFEIPTRTTSQTVVAPFGGEVWCIPKTTPAKEAAAFKVLESMSAGTNIVPIAKGIDDVPTRQSDWNLSPWNEPVYAPFLAELRTARARTKYFTTDETTASLDAGQAIEAAVIGKQSVVAALDAAQQQISKLKTVG